MPDYAKLLNKAQYEAVTAPPGHTLVVAGAGTGKTRTIVCRLAWLIEQGALPESLLLLTFTRKAAQEMLSRAGALLGQGLGRITGGTFHSFAFACLRAHRPKWLGDRPFTLMDSGDIAQAVKDCKENLKIAKKDHSFPKTQTIAGLISKARNKEQSLSAIIAREGSHLLAHAPAIEEIAKAYQNWRRERALLDYDDLLFELEDLLKRDERAAYDIRRRFAHILVDEYQDTNLVQARITLALSQPAREGWEGANVMAVGDEAQSIYAFRGANVQNILDFPRLFPNARIVRLEENYRSDQPILDVANGILANAAQSFRKRLFTSRQGGEKPLLMRPVSDISEADLVAARIADLLATHRPHEIAVLFRAGFHSYALENALRKSSIEFRKYGGLRFVEAAHIKDILAFARLAINPLDFPAFSRLAQMCRGIGPKTTEKLHAAIARNDPAEISKAFARYKDLWRDMELIRSLAALTPERFFEEALAHYRPRLEELYPDDWPSRTQGLEEILGMAAGYDSLDVFVADVALDSPDPESDQNAENSVTLSTVHSAKGLEWKTVILLDVIEDRFPSRHALVRPEDYEEERRLFYVACTRAMHNLEIYAPAAVYSRNGSILTAESPFVRELPEKLFRRSAEGGAPRLLRAARTDFPEPADNARSGIFSPKSSTAPNNDLKKGYCRHRIFGRGKIIQHLGDDRVQVNFPGFGLKVILADYLLPED